ncbi:MAG: hypothetical protein IKO82_06450 [Prevotella sp.]|nr:hypothetical protein [Prevotella sp.]
MTAFSWRTWPRRWKGKESELGDWAKSITFSGDRKSTAYMQRCCQQQQGLDAGMAF